MPDIALLILKESNAIYSSTLENILHSRALNASPVRQVSQSICRLKSQHASNHMSATTPARSLVKVFGELHAPLLDARDFGKELCYVLFFACRSKRCPCFHHLKNKDLSGQPGPDAPKCWPRLLFKEEWPTCFKVEFDNKASHLPIDCFDPSPELTAADVIFIFNDKGHREQKTFTSSRNYGQRMRVDL